MVPAPGIDVGLGADQYLRGLQRAEPGPIATGRCLRIEEQAQMLELLPLVPAPALCIGLPASTGETG